MEQGFYEAAIKRLSEYKSYKKNIKKKERKILIPISSGNKINYPIRRKPKAMELPALRSIGTRLNRG